MDWVNSTVFIINFEILVFENELVHVLLGVKRVITNGVLGKNYQISIQK